LRHQPPPANNNGFKPLPPPNSGNKSLMPLHYQQQPGWLYNHYQRGRFSRQQQQQTGCRYHCTASNVTKGCRCHRTSNSNQQPMPLPPPAITTDYHNTPATTTDCRNNSKQQPTTKQTNNRTNWMYTTTTAANGNLGCHCHRRQP
jgi:hypothetical protein